jgi:hypothetical protein
MPEETKIPLIKQMEAVKKLVDKSPLIVYLTAVIGIISVGISAHFAQLPSEPLWIAGLVIAMTCTSFGTLWVINAKREFKNLVEQLNSKS